MDYEKLAKDIITNVGGPENIDVLSHCMTRLRFNLKDVSKVNKDALENLKGVVGTVYAGGQFMVIMGKDLLPVYEEITKNFDLETSSPTDENLDAKKEPWTLKNAGNKIIGFVSAAVTPMVPGLIAGGMLKVVLILIVTFISPNFAKTTSYTLISAISDAPFYFMPIMVAYGAALKLGATPVYSMVATAALLHGEFIKLVADGKVIELFGLPVKPLSYGTTLLPALLISIVAFYAEKYLNKIVPGIFKSIFVGMGTVLISGSLGFLILGPLGNMLGQFIADAVMFLNSHVGPLALGLLAGFMPWLVMTGMHSALGPFLPQLIANPGFDPILRPAFFLHNMSEGGAVLGVALKTKDKEFRSECFSLAVGCILAGVSEPTIYGVNLKLKKPMYGVMAGGFVSGFLASILGVKAYVMGYSNILALPIFKETVTAMVVAVIIAILVSMSVTMYLYSDEKKVSDHDVVAIADGNLIDLSEVNDEAFASGDLGQGIAMQLTSDTVCAPANGKLETMFPTGHAFGIVTNEGLELLVHIGIDTVQARGNGFEILVHQGEVVKAGQPIVKINRHKLEQEGYDLTTMLVVAGEKRPTFELKNSGAVHVGERISID